MPQKQTFGIDNGTLLAVGGISALAYFGVLNPLLKLFGIKESDASKKVKDLDTADYFNPNFWRKGGVGTLIINAAGAQGYTKLIYDSKGTFNDDEAKLYGVFRALKTKSQVSYLAMKFQERYSKGLYEYIKNFLNDGELVTLKNILDPLPNFKV